MSIAAAPARCTPCLRVFADTLFVDDGSRRGDEVRTAMLRLDFDYSGRRIRSIDPRPSAARDTGAEVQARRVLESFGVKPNGPLGADDYAGLTMPAALWE